MAGANMTHTGPDCIVLIRHAEKPLGDGPPHGVTSDGLTDRESLTPRGWQRAGALVGAFTRGGFAGSGLPAPTHLVASKVGPESSSQRPLQTLQPLAERLGLAVDTRFLKREVGALAEWTRRATGVVLISWEHHLIPSIVDLLLGEPANAPHLWPDDRYDLIWVCERETHGRYTFRQLPQLLLAGDSNTVIPR